MLLEKLKKETPSGKARDLLVIPRSYSHVFTLYYILEHNIIPSLITTPSPPTCFLFSLFLQIL